jgi:hypothetical protein
MLMTKLTLISALLLVSSSALAEDTATAASSVAAASFSSVSGAPQVDDLDVPRRGRLVKHHGFYAAPTFGVTTMNSDVAPIVGMRAAWLANRTFGLGFSFNALANELDEPAHYKGRALGGYGGLLLQYVIGSSHAVHGFIDTTVGGGVMCLQTGVPSEDGLDDCSGHGFFMVEPTANIEFNVARFMRISLGVGYRVAVAGDASEISSDELGGIVSKTALQFGRF